MEKVSSLPIDLGKSTDFKSVSFTSVYNNKENNRAFSQELNKQMFSGNSGNNNNTNGNRERPTTINEARRTDNNKRTAQNRATKNRIEDNRVADQRAKDKRTLENRASNDPSIKIKTVDNKSTVNPVINRKSSMQKITEQKSTITKNDDNKVAIQKNKQVANKDNSEKQAPLNELANEQTSKSAPKKQLDNKRATLDTKDEKLTESEQLIALLQNAEKTLVPTSLPTAQGGDSASKAISDEVTASNTTGDDGVAGQKNDAAIMAALLAKINGENPQLSSDTIDNNKNTELLQQLSLLTNNSVQKNQANNISELASLTAKAQQLDSNNLPDEPLQPTDENGQALSEAELVKFLQDKLLIDKSFSPQEVEQALKTYLDSKAGSEEKALDGKLVNALGNKFGSDGVSSEELGSESLSDKALKRANDLLKTLQLNADNKSVNAQKPVPAELTAAANITKQNIQTDAELNRLVNASDDASESDEQDISIEQLVSADVNKADAAKQISSNLAGASLTDITANMGSNLAGEKVSSNDYTKEELQNIQTLQAMTNKISDVNAQKLDSVNRVETLAIHRKDFTSALQDKVMVLVQQKIRQVDIRLDPPELGSMQIRLNLQNEQASIHFIVQNQQAKEILDQNMPKLREMLAEQGVNVGDANVGHRNEQTNDHNEQGQFTQQGNGFVGEDIDGSVQVLTASLTKEPSVGVDYYA
ncbi:MAG: flagellar hook-length control protein FliK [Alteromonadaceae bacterium]|nr:flagellar hook-length control protein FliK [Alteromonadaceae bacterium]